MEKLIWIKTEEVETKKNQLKNNEGEGRNKKTICKRQHQKDK